MMSFILSAAVLVIIALLFIVPVLLKKNQPVTDEYDELNVDIAKERLKELKQQLDAAEITEQNYQQQREELESSLALDLSSSSQQAVSEKDLSTVVAKSKSMPIILSIIIPLCAIGIYSQLGDFDVAIGNVVATAPVRDANAPQLSMQDALTMLEQRMAKDPSNADGWFMLGKTYMTMRNYPKAVQALEKTIELVGEEPELLIRYVDALAMTENGKLLGKAKPILEKLIIQAPENPTVLWMAGTLERQQNNHTKALGYWYKLRVLLGNDKTSLDQVNPIIKEAETHLNADQLAKLQQAMSVKAEMPEATANAVNITVSVTLDPALKDKVSASDTLFIYAKALQGPPMPLAAVKQTVASLPLTVDLNDAMAMMPQMKLSNFEQVKIMAVISKSGRPGTQVGDLFAEVFPVDVKAVEKIKLIINQVK